MKVPELYADWSQDVAKNLVDSLVVPRLPAYGVGAQGEAVPTLIHFSRRSAIFRLQCVSTTYALKVWGPSTPAAHTVDAAYRWLKLLQERDPDQGRCPSPRPVAALPDARTIVMEWVDAKNLRRTIVGGNRYRGLIGVLLSFAWLENFHAMSPAISGPFRCEARFALAKATLDRHAALIADADRPTVTHAMETLERLAFDLKPLMLELRFLHHDATCANFLFDGRRAIGIDLHEMRQDDPLIDYCYFLVDADVLLNPGSEPEPPYAISQELQDLLTRTPLIRDASRARERIRVNLLSVCLTRYAQRLPTANPSVLLERQRHLRLAEALASDAFMSSRSPITQASDRWLSDCHASSPGP